MIDWPEPVEIPEDVFPEDRVKYVEPEPTEEPDPECIGVVALRFIRDSRPDISRVGVKSNSIGQPMGSVELREGEYLPDLLERHLKRCFRKAGYKLENMPLGFAPHEADTSPYLAMVDVEIRSFWARFMPGVMVVDASSDVQFDVSLIDCRSERPFWRDTCRGRGLESGPFVTGEMYEKSLNHAYSESLRSLRDELRREEVQELIAKHGAASETGAISAAIR